MKTIFKFALSFMITGALSMGFVSCSSDDDNDTPDFNNKVYGQQAMNACEDVINQMNLAMNQIEKSNLTEAQKTELQQQVADFMDFVNR
jgi:hypothetical protein